RPQRTLDSVRSPPAVLEYPFPAGLGLDSFDPQADRPEDGVYSRRVLVGQRRLPLRAAVVGPTRVSAHRGSRTALALSVGTILGRQRTRFPRLALWQRAVAEARSHVVVDLRACLVHPRPLRHLSHAGRT